MAYEDYANSLQENATALFFLLDKRCKRIRRSPLFPAVAELIMFGASVMDIAHFLRAHDPVTFGVDAISDDALRMEVARLRRYATGDNRTR